MNDVLTTDDPLYTELYDVRREAEVMGNLVEIDPYPPIAALRERAPVHKGFLRQLLGLPEYYRHVMAAGREGFSALSFEACEAAFRDHVRFSSRISHHPNESDEQTMGVLEMDGPIHRSYRRALQPMFLKPQAFGWWRTRWIDEIVANVVERLHGRDRAELNLDVCARIPVHTITRAIGLEGNDALTFRDAFVKSGGLGRFPPEVQKAAAETVDRMLRELIARRRAEPGDDVVSRLIATEVRLPDGSERPLNDREVVINCRLIMIAGGGTSWRQLGITLWALLTHPDQYEAVKADRSLVANAIEESTRWNPTAPVFSRLVAEDTEFHGVPMPAGAVLEICLGAANRDPARWDNPDAYDLHRPIQPNLAFGIGQHRCLGINVAHAELTAAMNALFDAFPNMRLDPDQPAPFLTGGLEQRGISALQVLLR